jgi:hypothetical protein
MVTLTKELLNKGIQHNAYYAGCRITNAAEGDNRLDHTSFKEFVISPIVDVSSTEELRSFIERSFGEVHVTCVVETRWNYLSFSFTDAVSATRYCICVMQNRVHAREKFLRLIEE